MEIHAPRIMIAAPRSGSGKTLVTCGILKCLKQKNIRAAAFKCGPDYIDPMFHEKILGTPSKNLDTYFVKEDEVRQLFCEDAQSAEISVMEGVMGYYDGVAGTTTDASAYDLARVTETPVILVVDGTGASVSVCAVIKGFLKLREPSYIQGVILNKVSPMLYPRLKELIETECGIRVCGYLPKLEQVQIQSRYLGLTAPEEIAHLEEMLSELSETCSRTLDLDGILAVARGAGTLQCGESLRNIKKEFKCRIAVAKDEAFSFYYKDNLRLLEKLGAELMYFSPIRDKALPEGTQGLLFGGGYPELYAEALSRNARMRENVREAVLGGMPCIAECGGFLYLLESMKDAGEKCYPMAGVIAGTSYYTGKLGRFGYIELQSEEEQMLCARGEVIRGHEFHYFDSTANGESFLAKKPKSSRMWKCGHGSASLYAGFGHLYFYSNIEAARRFLRMAKKEEIK